MEKVSTNGSTYLAFIAGFFFTILLLMLEYNKLVNEEENRFFKELSQIKEATLLKSMRAKEVADHMGALFKASDYVEAGEFQIIAEEQLEHYPYILYIAYLPYLPRQELPAFELEMQEMGFVTYGVRDKTDEHQAITFPVKYIEPLTPHYATLLGLNFASLAKYKVDINEATYSGETTTSQPETLLDGHEGFVLFQPLFSGGKSAMAKKGGQGAHALIALQVDVTRIFENITIPKGFQITWTLNQESYTTNVPKLSKAKAFTENTMDEGQPLLFSTLQSEAGFDFGEMKATMHFEKRIYWRDVEFIYLLASFVLGIVVMVLLLMLSHAARLRNLELNARHEEIENQVREKTRDLQKLSYAIKGAFDAIVIVDAKGVVEFFNPAFSAMFGYTKNEVMGKHAGLFQMGFQKDEAVPDAVWINLLKGQAWSGQKQIKHKNDSYISTHMSIAPIVDDQNHTTHFVAIYQDLSEQEAIEDKLRQSQKMEAVGTLVGGIAHDFNNLLAAIQGNIYLARRRAGEPDHVVQKLNHIESLADKAAEMVRQMLTFARKGQVNMHHVNLNTVVKEGSILAESGIPENIQYRLNISSENLVVDGDETQLQQVLINLLSNARDAVKNVSKPSITCELCRFDKPADFISQYPEMADVNLACLSIADNGCGIQLSDLEHVFEPFYTTKAVGEGTGLGLSMVYGAVQTHGGLIVVESDAKIGTTFKVYLPIKKEIDIERKEKRGESDALGEGETILLVDDDAIRRATREVLVNMGYKVVTASHGKQGFNIFSENPKGIDAIISDIVMPKMSGYELAKKVRALRNRIPILLVTGYDKGMIDHVENSLEHIKILHKPFSFQELTQILRELLKAE